MFGLGYKDELMYYSFSVAHDFELGLRNLTVGWSDPKNVIPSIFVHSFAYSFIHSFSASLA